MPLRPRCRCSMRGSVAVPKRRGPAPVSRPDARRRPTLQPWRVRERIARGPPPGVALAVVADGEIEWRATTSGGPVPARKPASSKVESVSTSSGPRRSVPASAHASSNAWVRRARHCGRRPLPSTQPPDRPRPARRAARRGAEAETPRRPTKPSRRPGSGAWTTRQTIQREAPTTQRHRTRLSPHPIEGSGSFEGPRRGGWRHVPHQSGSPRHRRDPGPRRWIRAALERASEQLSDEPATSVRTLGRCNDPEVPRRPFARAAA